MGIRHSKPNDLRGVPFDDTSVEDIKAWSCQILHNQWRHPDHRRHVRNEDLRTELDYYSKKYDEEREMEPKLVRVREATSVLRIRSPHVRRHKGRVVEFKDALNRDGSKTERESDGRRTTLF
ncbi:hypothetical protein Tco_0420559 [Tanacetum coccineum]